jgi:hypothetical protein
MPGSTQRKGLTVIFSFSVPPILWVMGLGFRNSKFEIRCSTLDLRC